MSWIFKYGVSAFSVLCYIVILNGICGWIGFGIWNCLKRIWERNGQYEILYYCLKIVILLFILPLGWIMIVSRNQMLGSNITYNWYPWTNSKMAVFLTSVFVIWFLGASKNFMEYAFEKKYLRQLEGMGELLTEQEKAKLVNNSLSAVYICSDIYSPMVSGVFRKKLYLPQNDYDAFTLDVIIEHELTHLRHHDLLYKNMCALITIIYWFCPWVQIIFKEYDCWSEELCDMELCIGKNAKWTAKEYYSVIFTEIKKCKERKLKRCAALFEDQNTVEWRLKTMKYYHNVKSRKKWLCGALVCIFLFSCPATALASGNGVETGLNNIYNSTITEIEEPLTMDGFNTSPEITEELDENSNTVVISRPLTRGASTYTWTIKKGQRYVVNNISLKEGDQVNMRVKITSGTGPADMGIIRDTSKRYVSVMKDESHIFKIDKKGLYNFFVENKGPGEITVEYTYSF